MLRGVDLGRKDAVDLLGLQRGDRAVVEHPGGVHHGGQRDPVEHGGERVAVGDVAGGDLGVGAKVAQGGQELERAVGVGPAPREQQQVLDAVGADEVLGDERPEATRAAGDEHRSRPEGHVVGGLGDALQARRQQFAVAQCELRLVGELNLVADEVEQPEAAGMLGLRAAHEAPDSRAGHVGRLADGAARDEHEPCGGQRVVRPPFAQQREGGVHGGMRFSGGELR